jgi:RimJ/RimL family protein N-acetyltransferase
LTDAAGPAADGGAGPRHIVRGEHVFLRPAERADIPLFVGWLNDAETASFLSVRAPLSVPLEEAWFERMVATQGKEHYHFVICLLDTEQPIGVTSLFDIDHVNGNAGIGITIGEKSLWGRGYGTDAMNAILDFGFGVLRLERLWLDVYDFNARARRSYEKSGFVLEGTQRNAVFLRGRPQDVLLMSMLRAEWDALNRPRSWDY